LSITAMRREFLWVCVAAVMVGVVFCDTSTATDESKLATMSKDELVAALSKSQAEHAKLTKKLSSAKKKIHGLKHDLAVATGDDEESELARQKNERKHKAHEKKKAAQKKQAQLKKKAKLSDILMEHGAKFLAFKKAKSTSDQSSVTQKKAVLAAAEKGGRAGAVGPLTKVIRAAAVAAIKKSRAENKKKGMHNKHDLRKASVAAAKAVVNKMLADQDALVKKVAKKWTDAAIEKYPPSVTLAEDDDKPNNFVAPPSIHLSLGGASPQQVEELKENAATSAKKEDAKPATIHLSLGGAKADAIVPEK